jgi:hypothetical protein
MNKILEDLNSSPKAIYLAGVALGIIMTAWYDGQTGSSRWLIIFLGAVFVVIGLLGIKEKK